MTREERALSAAERGLRPPAGEGVWGARAGGGGGAVERINPGRVRDKLLIASRTLAASSGNVRSARHSSRPSCQTRDSSVTAPMAAFRRTSATRIGPTGTPLIATYHSSLAERSDMSNGVDASSSRGCGCGRGGAAAAALASLRTAVLNAPSSALAGRSGFGGILGAVRACGPASMVAEVGTGDAVEAEVPGDARSGTGDETLVSVTAARTSMRWPHLRHFMRTVLPTAFSSAI